MKGVGTTTRKRVYKIRKRSRPFLDSPPAIPKKAKVEHVSYAKFLYNLNKSNLFIDQYLEFRNT